MPGIMGSLPGRMNVRTSDSFCHTIFTFDIRNCQNVALGRTTDISRYFFIHNRHNLIDIKKKLAKKVIYFGLFQSI